MRLFSSLLALVLAIGPAGAQSYGPAGNSSVVIPNFTANGGLPNWKACRAQVKAGSGSCNILIAAAESTTTGHGSFYANDANDAHSGAWGNQLATLMNLPGTNINFETQSITGTASHAVGIFGAFDTRATVNGWLAYAGVFVIGGSAWTNGDTTAFTFNPTDTASYPNTPAIQSDTLDIYMAVGPGATDSTTVDIGGSPICTFTNVAASNQLIKNTCSVPLGANTYNIKCTTASLAECTFILLHAYKSTVPRVAIFNGAAAGSVIAEFNSTTTGSNIDPIASIATFAPKLCITMELENDWLATAGAQTTIATFTTQLTAWVNGCKAAGADVLLLTGLPDGSGGPIISFTSNSAGTTTLTTLSVTGTIVAGQTLTGTGIPGGVTIISQLTGTPGGAGTYQTSSATTLTNVATTAMIPYASYQAAVIAIAAATNVPVWDSLTTFGTFSNGEAAGWLGSCCGGATELNHKGVAANVYIASIIQQILLQ